MRWLIILAAVLVLSACSLEGECGNITLICDEDGYCQIVVECDGDWQPPSKGDVIF